MSVKQELLERIVLVSAGALLLLIAGLILLSPAGFYASNQIVLGVNPSLINELKAPAGLLLVSGVFIVSAVFRVNRVSRALWLGALIYLSYAGSRFASMALDGAPAPGLVQAAWLEVIVGLACLGLLLRDRQSRSVSPAVS